LALLGAAAPTDKTLAKQTKAATILEKYFPTYKDHPGVSHYLIHAYDYPPVADKGLPAARNYASVAPWVPHALHMPSHIFTRLGMWQEAADSNLASADAAKSYSKQRFSGTTWFEELHALDYLAYAYLQSEQDSKAKAVLDRLGHIEQVSPSVDFVTGYAAGAIPARYALERRQWAEAAKLPLANPQLWQKFPFAEAHLEFARAIGAARSGDAAAARKAQKRLEELAANLPKSDPRLEFFSKQVDIQAHTSHAWLLFAEGKKQEALTALRSAADEEDALGKHPVSPGAIYPVRELLADMLLELKRPADALTEYEKSLKLYPRRYNGLYGAAQAAELSGKLDVARKFYETLLEVTRAGDGARPEIKRAREFVTHASAK
jgi:tetratricopeptide (TPR) repeat protein